jgi:8-oxo-dGTP diphosphatase
MKRVTVTCAIIKFQKKFLVVQRNGHMQLPYKWEFPGGKLEPNESEVDCIKREIKEEICIDIEIIKKLTPINFNYPNVSIRLIPFLAKHTKGEISLKEHKEYLLLEKQDLLNLDWSEADIPIVEEILRL